MGNYVAEGDTALDFDVYLLRTGDIPFELANLQMGITYAPGFRNGTLKVTVVPGSSQLVQAQIPTSINTSTTGVIKIAPKPNPGIGNGTIISNEPPGTRVAVFRIVNSLGWTFVNPDFTWSFSTYPYNSTVSAYCNDGTGTFYAQAITNTASHQAQPAIFYSGLETHIPTFECQMKNGVKVNDRTYEFDVVLYQRDAEPLKVNTLQMAIGFNPALTNGSYTFSLVPGTSQFLVSQVPQVFDAGEGIMRIFKRTITFAGEGTVISTSGTRVGRFRITSTNPLNTVQPDFHWVYNDAICHTFLYSYVRYGYGSIVVTSSNVNSCYTVDLQNYLPVELAGFSAQVQERSIVLHWLTASEHNTEYFSVERSLVNKDESGRSWSTIAKIDGHGNTVTAHDYQYTDEKLNSGIYAYRLKIVDYSGAFTYSKLETKGEIDLPRSYSLSQNYPNPFNPATKIDFQLPEASRVTLSVFSLNGEKIADVIQGEEMNAGYYTSTLSSQLLNHSLSSGVYIYRLTAVSGSAKTFSSIKKMVYMK